MQQFVRKQGKKSCWYIRLDDHDMGFLPHADEEFEASLHPADADGKPITDEWIKESDWADPRKGELHAPVEALKNQESENSNTGESK